MFQTIADNLGTILVTLVLIGIVTAAVLQLRRDRKQGKSSCGCGCSGCPMAGSCRKGK